MLSRRFAWLASGIAAAGVAFAVSCATLEPMEAGICGNGVVDPLEDCDEVPDGGAQAQGDAGRAQCVARGAQNACHYKCTTSGACPVGWGCNLNAGICARPSGEFKHIMADVRTGAVRMVKGDFDGDGRLDLVASGPSGLDGTASATAIFFEQGMRIRERRRIPVPMGAIAVFPSAVTQRANGESDGGAESLFPVSDLGYASSVGVGVLRGGSEDALVVPELFPYAALQAAVKVGQELKPTKLGALIPVPLPPKDGSLRGQVNYLGVVDAAVFDKGAGKGPRSAVFRYDFAGGAVSSADVLVELPGAPSDVRFTSGPTDQSLCLKPDKAVASCGEVLVWSQFDDAAGNFVYLVDTTLAVGPLRSVSIPLPPGTPPAETVAVGYVDDDRLLDAVIGQKPRNLGEPPPCPMVVSGNAIQRAALAPAAFSPPLLACVSPFLGLADLNGDTFSDLVFGGEVRLSEVSGGGDAGRRMAFRTTYRRASQWTQMEVGDVDGDGRVDAILATTGQGNLDVFRGSDGQAAVVTIPTPEPVERFVTGHFDADGLVDVAYTSKLLTVGKAASVYVLFGGPEHDTVRVGTKDLSQLVNLRRPVLGVESTTSRVDVDILGLVRDPDTALQAGGPRYGEKGDAAKQTLLYAVLAPEGRALVSVARAAVLREREGLKGRGVAVGNFSSPTTLDAVQLLLPSPSSGKPKCDAVDLAYDTDLLSPTLPVDATTDKLPYGPLAPIALAVASVGDPPTLFSVGYADGEKRLVFRSRQPRSGGAFETLLSRPYSPAKTNYKGLLPPGHDVDVCNPDVRLDNLSPAEKLALIDLDGDGTLEVVFSDGGRLELQEDHDARRADGGAPSTSSLWPGVTLVLRKSDGKYSEVPLAGGGTLRGRSFAHVRLPGNRSGLAVLGSDGVTTYTLSGGALARASWSFVLPAPDNVQAQAMEAGDFDGDGLDDIAILSGGKLIVYSGTPLAAGDAGAP